MFLRPEQAGMQEACEGGKRAGEAAEKVVMAPPLWLGVIRREIQPEHACEGGKEGGGKSKGKGGKGKGKSGTGKGGKGKGCIPETRECW